MMYRACGPYNSNLAMQHKIHHLCSGWSCWYNECLQGGNVLATNHSSCELKRLGISMPGALLAATRWRR